jgi:hypothetical protein
MKAASLILITFLFLTSCQTCREVSIRDAAKYSQLGYQTRIVVYEVGLDGKIAGLGLWKFHAQAQYFDGEWKWVGGQDYTIDGKVYYWQPEIYKAVIEKEGK